MQFSHPDTELAGQPIGFWSWAAHNAVVGHIREELSAHGVSQPQWWVLAQLAGSEEGRMREELTDLLSGYLDAGRPLLESEMDALIAQGRAVQDASERLRLTAEGADVHAELATLQHSLRERIHTGIEDEEYVRTLKVLQRMIHNVGARYWHH